MKNLLVSISILLILISSCTKEYSEISNKSICIGKLTQIAYNDSTWIIELFNNTDSIIDTTTVDFSKPLTISRQKWYPLSEDVTSLDKIYNDKVEMIGHKIPEEIVENPPGLYSIKDNPKVLYYLGFTKCNCEIEEKRNERKELCRCENGIKIAILSNDNSDIEVPYGIEQDVDNFYYFSLDYTGTKNINVFINNLYSTVDELINE